MLIKPNKEKEYAEFRKKYNTSEPGKHALEMFDNISKYFDRKDWKSLNKEKIPTNSDVEIPIVIRAMIEYHVNGLKYVEYMQKKAEKKK
jgi:hypothetical protein